MKTAVFALLIALGAGQVDAQTLAPPAPAAAPSNIRYVTITTAAWAAGLALENIIAMNSCRRGCDGPGGPMFLVVGALGAGIGAAIGAISRADGRRASGDTNPRFRGPSGRIGLGYNQLAFRSGSIGAGAGGRTVGLTMQLSPRISTHVEFSTTNRTFLPAPNSVPAEVLANVVPATARVASPRAGIERRDLSFTFSQLAGVEVGQWDRVRVEALAGVGVQGYTKRDYFPAYDQPGRPIPGKFYVLDFESPEGGFLFGVDAEIAVAAGVAVVPTFRYFTFGDPGPAYSVGVGAHWRFGR